MGARFIQTKTVSMWGSEFPDKLAQINVDHISFINEQPNGLVFVGLNGPTGVYVRETLNSIMDKINGVRA